MAKKDNAPIISFFSFQDIITSITGIMFLVVLILLLLMLEMSKVSRPERKDSEPLAELRKKLVALRKETALRTADTEKAAALIAELRKLNPALLEERRQRLVAELQELNRKEDILKNSLRSLTPDKEQFEKERPEIEARLSKLTDEVSRLKTDLEASEKQVATEQKKLEERMKIVQYTVSAGERKQPVLVECGTDGFKVKPLKGDDEAVTSFPAADKAGLTAAMDKLVAWAGRFNKDEVYFFLLAKPSVFPEVEALAKLLSEAGFDRGREVMPSDESTVFGGGD